MTSKSIDFYRKKYKMRPLLGNDYLRDLYTYRNDRTDSSCSFVYYLLKGGCVFPFHKMSGVSTWQYCDGCDMEIYMVSPEGELTTTLLGRDAEFLHITLPNHWFAAVSKDAESFTLVTHCLCPEYRNESDVFGFYEDLAPLMKGNEELARALCCVKGVSDAYRYDGQDGYK